MTYEEFKNSDEKTKKMLLDSIERYYPGVENLTSEEILEYANFDILHEFQTYIALNREIEEKYVN